MRVDPGALDPKAPRQLDRVDQLRPLESSPFEQLAHTPGDCLGRLWIELDARGRHLDTTVQAADPLHRSNPRKGGFPVCRAVGVGT
jgi:hypothetical protein